MTVWLPAGAARSATRETVQVPEESVKQPLGSVRRPWVKPVVAVRNDTGAASIGSPRASLTDTVKDAEEPWAKSGGSKDIVEAFWVTVTGMETDLSVPVEISTVYDPGAMAAAERVKETFPEESEVAVDGAARPDGADTSTDCAAAGDESVPVNSTSTVVEEFWARDTGEAENSHGREFLYRATS